ncbi:MAG: hypothetical protein BWY38_03190 [Ignavibacteria bacterium ADurb.Bin266]|nr:MAG: hypothetical protein BWY38_03190 [Ignavibacteria bacterium ADurb.Bin266]
MENKADKLKEYRDNLISFIEYLHKNRSYMKDDVKTISEFWNIDSKQWSLDRNTYEGRREFNALNKLKVDKASELTWDNLIISKAKELKLFISNTLDIKDNLNIGVHLMYDIKPSEATKIIEAKEKYLTFRKDTEFCNFINGLFFTDLDEALIEFFGAFTDVSDMKRTQPEPMTVHPEADPYEVELITNNFNNDDIEKIKNHFSKLEMYMNNGDFMQWIRQAFELQETPQYKFKLAENHKKGEIRYLFYTYWGKKHNQKEKYVRLLSDYFDGFELKNTMTNFSKRY